MKRLICLILAILCVTAVFSGCRRESPNTQTTAPEADTTAPPTLADLDITLPKETEPPVLTFPINEDGLPEYVPGIIAVYRQDADDYDYERKYRILYYRIDQIYLDLLTPEQRIEFVDWFDESSESSGHGEFREEMPLAVMIKRYNIPREEFEKAIERRIELNLRFGIDMYREEDEIPNLDIFYTFDNEIINNFYRYE